MQSMVWESARSVERGEEPRKEGFHAAVRRCWSGQEAGDVALGYERRDQVGIPRQHMDRDGPWRFGLAADNSRRLVIAEQDDEPVTEQALGKPSSEDGEIIAQALEVLRGQPAPV